MGVKFWAGSKILGCLLNFGLGAGIKNVHERASGARRKLGLSQKDLSLRKIIGLLLGAQN